MIGGIFIFSLFAVAHAFPYKDFADSMKGGIEQLEDQILSMAGNIPNITDSRRHYAVLITHITHVVTTIIAGDNQDFYHTYIGTMPENIATALINIDDIILETATAIECINNATRDVQDLIETLCPETMPNDVCSQLMFQTINGDIVRYKRQSAIMILTGMAANELFKADFITVAKNHDEIDYLLAGKDSFINLIYMLVELIKFVTRRPRCEQYDL